MSPRRDPSRGVGWGAGWTPPPAADVGTPVQQPPTQQQPKPAETEVEQRGWDDQALKD